LRRSEVLIRRRGQVGGGRGGVGGGCLVVDEGLGN